MKKFQNEKVATIFTLYPKRMKEKLLFLRELIFKTAAKTKGVGELEETLKWGEPAYLTKSKSGTTIRINQKKSNPTQYAIYFHCQTNLIERFRTLFPKKFKFEGSRAILFDEADKVPIEELSFCIAEALTYHQKNRL